MENIKQLIRQKYTLSQTKESVKDIVRPRFMRLSLGGVVETFNAIPEEYRTDWSKLLKDVKTSKNVLSNLIKGLFGVHGVRLTYIMELMTKDAEKDVTMVFASTPDKKQQSLLVDLFREVLGPQYIVELINSDETSNREVEDQAKKTIARAKKTGKKVVFVSKDMASRSFSLSEIDTVILMFDRGSYSTITQKVSRVLTPGVHLQGST
jgi:ribosome-binding ATPase YchF (GTP1/OBG family)